MTYTKETIRRMSVAAKKRCTPEWSRKKSESMATKLDGEKLQALYASGHTQTEVANALGVSQKTVWGYMKRHGIPARAAAKRNQAGENNHAWKGEYASYKAKHQRMTTEFGQPKRCDHCGTVDARKSYDWATVTGRYDKPEDFRRLCRSCHRKMDNQTRAGVRRKGAAR